MNVSGEHERKMSSKSIDGARRTGPRCYVISSGIGSLDAILGGGIPAGSLVLIEEDEFGTYAKLLMKHFLSEGIMRGHPLFVASQALDSKKLVSELPAQISNKFCETTDTKLNIAWRYENMPKFNSAPKDTAPITNTYNVSSHISHTKIKQSIIEHYDGGPCYATLLKYIYSALHSGKYFSESDVNIRNILRIALHSLGTVLWEGDLIVFLQYLRAIIRNCCSACIISLPTSIFKDLYLLDRCEHLSDIALKLESLANKGNAAYSDYKGLLFLNKLPAMHDWNIRNPETADWGFKLTNGQFIIEKLHISPDLRENVNREEEDVVKEYVPNW